MARPLDDRQQADLSAFVNALAEAAGYQTTAEWSRESGYPAPNLSNLRNGRGAVDGYNLLRLIRAAGARVEVDPVALALATTQAAAADTADGLVAQRLGELAKGVAEALILLRAIQQPGRGGRRKPTTGQT